MLLTDFNLFNITIINFCQDLKNEKRRAQMSAARRTLERSTMMLLTTSKACLRHPDCHSARENRDTVFAQMRRAMDLIHFVVKEGIISSAKVTLPHSGGSSSSIVSVASGSGGAPGERSGPTGSGGGGQSPHHYRPTSSSSSSSSLHLPFDPHNDALLYGELSPSGVVTSGKGLILPSTGFRLSCNSVVAQFLLFN